ncbi:hypothetical protein ABTK17_19750, partial [Acinetobacter baumannii]
KLAFDVLNGRMTVLDEARETSTEAILKAVATTGMGAAPWQANAPKDGADDYRRQQLLFTAASGVAVLVGMGLHVWSSDNLADALRL